MLPAPKNFSEEPLSPLESARAWLARGWHPIPINIETKNPVNKSWQLLRLTEEQLPDYFNDGVNVGLLFGDDEGHADVDCDTLGAVAAARGLLPETGVIYGRASKPASHYLYILFPVTTTRQYKDPLDKQMLVELRCRTRKGTSSQSVAPYSVHHSRELVRFEPGTSFDKVTRLKGNDLNKAVASVAAAAVLAKYYPASGRHETELALAGALARGGWGMEAAVQFILATYTAVPTHDRGALQRIEDSTRYTFDNFKAGHETTGMTRLKTLIDPVVAETAFKWLNIATEENKSVAIIPAGQHWRVDLVTNDRGVPFPNLANVAITLRNADEWKDAIAYDEFACQAVFTKNVPAHMECTAGPIRDEHFLWMAEWMQSAGYPSLSDDLVRKAVYAVAMEKGRRFHPVRDYLNGLPPWDGTPRLNKWLHRYLGAKDDELSKLIGPMFLIMMIARAMEPGCIAQYTMILESPQGEMKSTFLRQGLMPKTDWFTDHVPDLNNKDAALQIQGIWLVELAELDAMGRADISRIKAFLTSPVDRLRPPYGRTPIDYPRQCVFIGTTNKREYLKDETGGRRFWPVAVGSWGAGKGTINIAALAKDRDQLFAEALQRYRAGERYHPAGDEHLLLKTAQDERYEEHHWTDKVLQWCEHPHSTATEFDAGRGENVPIEIMSTRDQISTTEILVHALNKPIGMIRKSESMDVANILTRQGWTRTRLTTGNRPWVYKRGGSQDSFTWPPQAGQHQ
jgi:predicted P-loop ATPase